MLNKLYQRGLNLAPKEKYWTLGSSGTFLLNFAMDDVVSSNTDLGQICFNNGFLSTRSIRKSAHSEP